MARRGRSGRSHIGGGGQIADPQSRKPCPQTSAFLTLVHRRSDGRRTGPPVPARGQVSPRSGGHRLSSGGMENFHIVPLPHRDTGGKRHDVGPQSDKAGMTIPGLIIISTVDAWCRNRLARPPGQDDNHRGSEPPRRAVPARDGRAPAGQAFVRWPLRQPIGNLCRSQQFFPRGVYSAGRAGFPAPQPGGRVVSQRRRVRPACSSDQPGSGRGAKR